MSEIAISAQSACDNISGTDAAVTIVSIIAAVVVVIAFFWLVLR